MLKVQHSKHWDKVVYEKVSYYGSLNPERLAFPSVARLAREVICSASDGTYGLSVGSKRAWLIKCVSRCRAATLPPNTSIDWGCDVTPWLQAASPSSRPVTARHPMIKEKEKETKEQKILLFL